MSDDGRTPPRYEFARLELKAGDILALKINVPMSDMTAGQYRERMDLARRRLDQLQAEGTIPADVHTIVVGPDVDLIVVAREEMEAAKKKAMKK